MVHQKKFFVYTASIFVIFFYLFCGFVRGIWGMTTEEEKKLGKKILLEMEKHVERIKDPTVQAFIDRVGNSIVREVGPTPFEFKFYVIKAQEPNAFAIPGGHIFVTTGLIVLAENEHEMAGVLGHETAHVMGRHVSELIERSKRLNIASMAAILAGALLGRGGPTTGAVATMAPALAEAFTLKYTREMETEADHNGLQYMIKTGYDPNGMITFLKKINMLSIYSEPNIPAYLLTHPAIESRISLLENLLQTGQRPVGPFKKVIGSFKRIQAKAFVEEREPDVSVSHFSSMIKANPQDMDGIFGLGLAFKKMGRLDKSTEVFQTGLSLSPKDPDLLREIGIVYFFSGKLDQAIENLEAAQAVPKTGTGQDNDLLSLYYLGRCYQERGDLANALPLLQKVQKEMPEFIDVYHSLGSVYGRMGQKGLSHFYFGRHFKLRGERKNALLHFRTALEWLERGSPIREETQSEIRELTDSK
jgi:predicted Zn-dependent protease